MSTSRSWMKIFTAPRFLISFILIALALSASLVIFAGPDLLLLSLVAPILISAHYVERRYYLWALLVLTGLSLWVIYATSTNLPKSLLTLAIIFVAIVVTCEGVYRLSELQRRMLKRLHASERWFHSIFADSPIAIELFDGAGRLLDMNRAGLQMFGVASVEAVKGFRLFDDPNVTDDVKARLRKGETVHYTNRFDFEPIKTAKLYETERSGIIELDVQITPLGFQPDKSPEGYLVLAQDITEQLHHKRALEESEAMLRAIFNASDDGILLTDESGTVIEFSQGMERITGWPRQEMLGVKVWEMEHRLLSDEQKAEIKLDNLRSFTENALQTGTAPVMVEVVEKPVLHLNGDLVMVELQTFAIPTEFGFRLGSICHDISERYRAAAALRESEERYRILAGMSSDSFAILRVDPDGAMHSEWCTSKAFVQLTGYPLSELAALNLDLSKLILPEERAQMGLDPSPGLGTMRQEFRITTKDQQIRWMRRRYRFVHDAEGRPTLLYLAIEDVTDLKEVEQQALAFRLEKEQTRLLTHFVQNATHEFRTPLSVINLDLHFLLRAAADEPQRRRLTRISEQVKTLSNLVDALITLSSLDSEVPLDTLEVDLAAIVGELAAHYQPVAQAKGITFTVDLPASLPAVWGAPDYISRAIDGLLDNAIRYTEDGGQVHLYSESDDGRVRIVVQDSGIGIAPDIQPRIFDRFYRLDEAHSTQGFGLGLPIAQKVAERHGGRISMESEVGKGSVFVLELPVEKRDDGVMG